MPQKNQNGLSTHDKIISCNDEHITTSRHAPFQLYQVHTLFCKLFGQKLILKEGTTKVVQ